MVTLKRPFPAAQYVDLWTWMAQFPDNNFDDFGKTSLLAFVREMDRRAEEEETFLVRHDGIAVGAIGYIRLNSHLGMFHGICFDRRVHGLGVAAQAVKGVLDRAFATGIYKVSAEFHADNLQVAKFLKKLGGVDEALFRGHTLRNGQPIDKRVVSFFAHDHV